MWPLCGCVCGACVCMCARVGACVGVGVCVYVNGCMCG